MVESLHFCGCSRRKQKSLTCHSCKVVEYCNVDDLHFLTFVWLFCYLDKAAAKLLANISGLRATA